MRFCNEMPIQQKYWLYIGNVDNKVAEYIVSILAQYYSHCWGIIYCQNWPSYRGDTANTAKDIANKNDTGPILFFDW